MIQILGECSYFKQVCANFDWNIFKDQEPPFYLNFFKIDNRLSLETKLELVNSRNNNGEVKKVFFSLPEEPDKIKIHFEGWVCYLEGERCDGVSEWKKGHIKSYRIAVASPCEDTAKRKVENNFLNIYKDNRRENYHFGYRILRHDQECEIEVSRQRGKFTKLILDSFCGEAAIGLSNTQRLQYSERLNSTLDYEA